MQDTSIANRLAALATAVNDAAFADTGDLSDSAVAALIAVRTREPIAIQHIAAIVGLTHSATVRLVDRLEKGWLVRRQRRKGREVLVETTSRGKRRVRDLMAKRREAVEALTVGLSETDRKALLRIVETVLGAALDNGAEPERLCRYCDVETADALAEIASTRDAGVG